MPRETTKREILIFVYNKVYKIYIDYWTALIIGMFVHVKYAKYICKYVYETYANVLPIVRAYLPIIREYLPIAYLHIFGVFVCLYVCKYKRQHMQTYAKYINV